LVQLTLSLAINVFVTDEALRAVKKIMVDYGNGREGGRVRAGKK